MAFSSSDWTIDYSAKTITNNDSGTGNNLPITTGDYSKVGEVLELFKWLATEFASAAQMDDDYAFVSDTPTVYRFVNDWAFGNLQEDFKYLEGGAIESSDGNYLWSNLYSIGTQEEGSQLYMIQNDEELTPWWISGNIDILVPVLSGGSWIPSDNTAGTPTNGGVWIYVREFGDTFDHNFADLSGGGRTPIGINTAKDSGNRSGELYLSVVSSTGFTADNFVKGSTSGAIGKITSISSNDIYLSAVRGGTFVTSETLTEYSDREAQTATGESTTNDGATAYTNVVAGYTDITDTFGLISRDLNNGNGSQNYDVEIDCATRPMTEVYEWLKYLTRYGSTGATYTVNGDDGQEYRSCSEGTYTDVKVAPFGTLAGTTFYGARGVWVTNYSSADFVLIDASGTEQSPPNYQKVIAAHSDLSGCTIFVAELDGSVIKKDQYAISGTTTSTITVTASIDINKTPQTGGLRVGDTQYTFTSFSGSVFSGVTPDPSGETGSLYVPLLDVIADATTEQSDNIIYDSDVNVRTVVRRYGTKPYTQDTTFGSTGLSFSPILVSDPQAT